LAWNSKVGNKSKKKKTSPAIEHRSKAAFCLDTIQQTLLNGMK
jgi:hypothetical protein